MIRVCVESPLAGDFRRNVRYAQLCVLDSLKRGEAPYASHLLYPQVFDDLDEDQRRIGMGAGQEWLRQADLVALYYDIGISRGMREAEALAIRIGKPTVQRRLVGLRALFTSQAKLESALAQDPAQWVTRLG